MAERSVRQTGFSLLAPPVRTLFPVCGPPLPAFLTPSLLFFPLQVTDAPAAADLVDVADVAGMGKVVQDLIALKLPKNPTDGGQKTAPAPMEDDDGAKTPEQVGSDSEED